MTAATAPSDPLRPDRAFAADHFSGKTVLVTGAAGGIGLETAMSFARHGAEVVLADIASEAVAEAAASIAADGGNAHGLAMDVGDPASIAAGFDFVDRTVGRIDNLVTCAAIITAKRVPYQDWSHWRRVLDINLLGTFFCVREACLRMSKSGGGNIVCVASDAGVRGGGGLVADTAYAASKAAVLSMVKSIAREYAGSGIRINALNPGPSDTPMHATMAAELKAHIADSLPMKRMGLPEDMAAAILFLCSSAASFVYGSALDADGGAMFR